MTTTRGQHLIGREIGSCVLEKLLGYGGSSAVFLARSLTSDEMVAVKVFLPRSTLDGQMRKSFYRRFLREAEAASQLDHPHILTIYAYGEHDGMPYIVMPYMSGGTLAEYVQRHGPLSLQEAQRYLEQIGDALDYAHAHGCVHCDVKPANILLDSNGQAALSDFGIVRLMQAEEEATPAGKRAKNASEALMGTPDYVSPEQALGEKLDGRSDVYSLGATLYYLLSGGPPFQADSPIALALMHVHETPTPLGMLRADITPQIDLVLAQALAKWPEERFATAGAFCLAFEQALTDAGETPSAALKSARLAKRQFNSENSLFTPPPDVQPVVLVKPLAQTRFNSWRTILTLGLIALLLLGCVLTALVINSTRGAHPDSPGTNATPSGSSAIPDALLGNQRAWPTSSTLFFKNGRYHILNTTSAGLATAFYANHQLANFRLSVATSEISGSRNSVDYYGVIFRASADQMRYYLFEIMSWNGGQYGFLRSNGEGRWTMLAYGATPGLLTSAGQTNVLSVTAQDNAFTLAINGTQVGKTVRDHSNEALTSGNIGLVVEEQHSEVAFSQLHISQL